MSTQAAVEQTNKSLFSTIKNRYVTIVALVGFVCVAVYIYASNASPPAPSAIQKTIWVHEEKFMEKAFVSLAFDDGRMLAGFARIESQSKYISMNGLGRTLAELLEQNTSLRWAPLQTSGSDRTKSWTSVASQNGDDKTLEVRFHIYP